jgi:hypothetical protein
MPRAYAGVIQLLLIEKKRKLKDKLTVKSVKKKRKIKNNGVNIK